jgi:transcription initiation factor IIF auxiliary subunit
MVATRRRLTKALCAAALLIAAASPCLAAVTVKNTSSYVGAGRWDWTIFIDADPATLRQIECVEYVLHPTFRDPVRQVCNRPETKFSYSTNGWGTFTVKVNVRYRDGRAETLDHPLVFRQQAAPASLNVNPRNWSRQLEPGWWEWGVFIEGAAAELDRIRCVEYTLHPTFPNPVRVVCSRKERFLLTSRGWGTFTIGIKLMLNDGSIHQMSHPLRFQGSPAPPK